MRFMAKVTIWVPEALTASSIIALRPNLPVPRNSRELNSRFAIINFSIVSMF
jgi:hypothetical protein